MKNADDAWRDMIFFLSCFICWTDELPAQVAERAFPEFSPELYEKMKELSIVVSDDEIVGALCFTHGGTGGRRENGW